MGNDVQNGYQRAKQAAAARRAASARQVGTDRAAETSDNAVAPGPRQMSAGQRERAYKRMRRHKRRQALSYLILSAAVVVAAVVLCVTVLFRIRTIRVDGTSRYTSQTVMDASGIHTGQNLFTANFTKAEKSIHAACPYLGKVTVSRSLPATLVITVQEAAISGVVPWNGQYVLLDESGRVLEITAVVPSGVPVVKGLTLKSAQVGQLVVYGSQDKSALFQQIAQAVTQTGFQNVVGIDVTDAYNLSITCTNKNQKILLIKLGNSNYLQKKLRFARATIDQHLAAEEGIFDVTSVGKDRSITWFTPSAAPSSKPASKAASSKAASSQAVSAAASATSSDAGTADTGAQDTTSSDDGTAGTGDAAQNDTGDTGSTSDTQTEADSVDTAQNTDGSDANADTGTANTTDGTDGTVSQSGG